MPTRHTHHDARTGKWWHSSGSHWQSRQLLYALWPAAYCHLNERPESQCWVYTHSSLKSPISLGWMFSLMCLNCFTWWSQFNWWLAITLNLWLNTPVSSPTVPVVLKRNKVRWARFVSVRMYFFCHWCSQGAVFNLFMPIGGAYRPYRAPEGCFLYKRLSELMTVCFPAAGE